MKRLIIIYGLLLGGLGLLLFPIVTNAINDHSHHATVTQYDKDVKALSKKALADKAAAAKHYNEQLASGEQANEQTSDPFSKKDPRQSEQADKINSYANIVDVGGALGYITIPKINVELPIYNGTNDVVLSKGIGHLQNTAMPVGGLGTHSVLTGHRGLATATMFRHLDQLTFGDCFYIHTLDKTLAYQVDNVKIVNPSDTKSFEVDASKDYVTLLTCHPYMINSQRLLVRGHRIPYTPASLKQEQNKQSWWTRWQKWCYLAAVIVAGGAAFAWWYHRRRTQTVRRH